MKRILAAATLAALLIAPFARAATVGGYPNASTPLNGTERILADQTSGSYPCVSCTVNITPSMLASYTASLTTAFSILYNNNGVIGGLIPSATGQYCLDWTNLAAAPALVTCTSGSSAFSALTSGTNTTAAMVVGSGATLSATGTGTIGATSAPLTGITGLGTGVGTALAVNTGSAGAFVVNGGALGTPSSGVGTNITGVNAASVGGFTLPCTVPTLVSGDYLTNNGTTCSWAASGGGTVTTTGTPTTGTLAAFSGSTSITNATASQVLSLVNSQVCNAQTGTTYTFVIGDANNCVTMSNAAANTITVPANASVAFPVGTTLTVIQDGAGATTIQGAGSPVTLTSAKYGSSTTQTYVFPSEYSCVALQKTATDTWFVSSCDYNPGGGSGTVTDGAGTTTANELLASTTTAHTYSVVATLPTAAMPALTGDVTGTAGSLSVTVTKVNGGAIPASAAALASNSSSQIVAATTVTYLMDTGTAFTLGTGTGACATDSVVAAGAANGEVTCTGTTGASTLVVNLPTATHGWACTANDITTPAVLPESAFTTTSVTFSGTVTASDNIVLQCTGF